MTPSIDELSLHLTDGLGGRGLGGPAPRIQILQSDVAGMREVTGDSSDARPVTTGDVEPIAAAVSELKNESGRSRSTMSWRFVVHCFDRNRFVPDIQDVLCLAAPRRLHHPETRE